MKSFPKYAWKIIAILLLISVILGFFYYETSWLLRILIIFLGIISLVSLKTTPEIFNFLILYLGLYELYNIRYSLAIPLALVIIVVYSLSVFIFYLEARFNKAVENIESNILLLYLATAGLIILEIFLTMTFWPVDPRIKSMVIVVVFYLIWRTFYLYSRSVLDLKKIVPLIFISLLILGSVVAINMFYTL